MFNIIAENSPLDTMTRMAQCSRWLYLSVIPHLYRRTNAAHLVDFLGDAEVIEGSLDEEPTRETYFRWGDVACHTVSHQEALQRIYRFDTPKVYRFLGDPVLTNTDQDQHRGDRVTAVCKAVRQLHFVNHRQIVGIAMGEECFDCIAFDGDRLDKTRTELQRRFGNPKAGILPNIEAIEWGSVWSAPYASFFCGSSLKTVAIHWGSQHGGDWRWSKMFWNSVSPRFRRFLQDMQPLFDQNVEMFNVSAIGDDGQALARSETLRAFIGLLETEGLTLDEPRLPAMALVGSGKVIGRYHHAIFCLEY